MYLYFVLASRKYKRYNLTFFERLIFMEERCSCQNRPPRPAPEFLPSRNYAVHCDDVHTIRNLKNCMCYLWTKNGESNWTYPTGFDDDYLYGHVWNGQSWNNTKVPLESIESYY